MLKDFPPSGVLRRAATVALIDNNEVEEVRGKLLVDLLFLLGTGDRLIEAKVDFVCGLDTAGLTLDGGGDLPLGAIRALDGFGFSAEFCHRRAERAEVVHHRLVDQDIPVGEE